MVAYPCSIAMVVISVVIRPDHLRGSARGSVIGGGTQPRESGPRRRETSLSTPTSALLRHGRLTPRFLMFPHALVVWRRLAVPAWGGGHVDGVRGRVGCSRVGLVHSRGWSHEFADAVLPFSCMRARLQEFLRTVVLSPAGWAFLGVCSSYPTCSSPFACSSHSFLVPFHEFLVFLHFPGRKEKGERGELAKGYIE